MSNHVLTPRPPVRAFALAATLAVLGTIVVVAAAGGWFLVVLGMATLAMSVALVGLGLRAMQQLRVEVVLDQAGFRVVTPSGTQTGRWQDVTKASRADGQVILYGRDGRRTVIALPRGGAGDLDALGADIARRLDADRGYARG